MKTVKINNGTVITENGKVYQITNLVSGLVDKASTTFNPQERKKLVCLALGWANYLKPSPIKGKVLSIIFKLMNSANSKDAANQLRLAKHEKIRGMVNAGKGRFMSITFTKKNGDKRIMHIQPASLKFHLVGEAASESAKKATATRKKNHPNLLPVFDVEKQAVRSINMDTVQTVVANGETLEIA